MGLLSSQKKQLVAANHHQLAVPRTTASRSKSRSPLAAARSSVGPDDPAPYTKRSGTGGRHSTAQPTQRSAAVGINSSTNNIKKWGFNDTAHTRSGRARQGGMEEGEGSGENAHTYLPEGGAARRWSPRRCGAAQQLYSNRKGEKEQ